MTTTMDSFLTILALTMVLLVTVARCQHPCMGCERWRMKHPNQGLVMESIECHNPCRCPTEVPMCTEGVSGIIDGCQCCIMCARQEGESCNFRDRCDSERGLYCKPNEEGSTFGVCEMEFPRPCSALNRTFASGEEFLLNCSHSCICNNGSLICHSLCSDMSLSQCLDEKKEHPFCCEQTCAQLLLATMPSDETDKRRCNIDVASWSECSATCGLGYRWRWSNKNSECETRLEYTTCHIQDCPSDQPVLVTGDTPIKPLDESDLLRYFRHEVLHKCEPTLSSSDHHIIVENCVSNELLTVTYCGHCYKKCCEPVRFSQRSVPMTCTSGKSQLLHWEMIEKCRCYRCHTDNT